MADRVLVDDAAQRALAADAFRFSAALRRLEAAAVTEFGEPGKRVTGYPDLSAAAAAKRLNVRTDGDAASATLNGALLPLRLKRVDGRWRVDLSEWLRDPRVRDAGRLSRAAAEAAEAVAAEVVAGEFATADEAARAFRERRLASVNATRPASPTTVPVR